MKSVSPLVPLFVGLIVATQSRVEAEEPACPAEMVLVDGMYCPNIQAVCLKWLDPETAAARRCAEYGPSTCIGTRQHKRFCMERYEHTPSGNNPNELPVVNVDFDQAEAICKAEHGRMCHETEFEMACSGPELYPYTTGLVRDHQKCNYDINTDVGPVEKRTDHRKSGAETPECVSGYGIANLNGNVDEMWLRDKEPGPYKVVLRSGHWLSVRDRCVDARTTAHSTLYSAPTLGWRCCADPKETK